jgi:stearoyl-CoA desaturase (delta-9 desaturase)
LSRTHKMVNLAGIGLPFVGVLAGIVLLWDRLVGPAELAILAVGYVLTGIGITLGGRPP